MHSDMKVGLALGVLLLGVVAAFFFRNEPSSDEIPQLENAQHLDDQIAEKTFTPYLTGVDSNETDALDSLSNHSELSAFAESSGDISRGSRKTLAPPGLPNDWELPDFLKDPHKDGTAVVTGDTRFTGIGTTPDPIPAESQMKKQRTTVPIPEHNNAWTLTSKKKKSRAVGKSSVQATAHQMYRVQKGDTLSGLAKQYLGSSARFLDIYNANRDRLKSPNDLRVGMQIKIPSMLKPSRTISASKNSQSEIRNPKSPRPGSRFIPVKRHPFRPGTADNRSSRLEKEPKPTKRLSQTPPPDLPAIEESDSLNARQPRKPSLDDPISINE